MRRLELATWLAAHQPADPAEAAARDAILALVTDHPAPWSRKTMAPGHITASAFVLSPDGTSVLLIRHPTLGRWLQPGGHVEADDPDIVAAARREVVEETGLEAFDLAPGHPWLLDVDVHEIPENPAKGEGTHRHHDVRVLFRARTTAVRDTGEVDGVRWVPLDEVAAWETDDSVLRAIARLTRWRDAVAGAPPRHSPAAARNAAPIQAVLAEVIEPGDVVLELGAGTGQHAASMADSLEVGRWIPVELDDDGLVSVAHRTHAIDRVDPPRRVDLSWAPWRALEGETADLVYCANVIHIAPRAVMRGLMAGAAARLRPGGHLALYGPFGHGGTLVPESNAAFDADLRARNPRWGIRDLEEVVLEASRHGLHWRRTVPMPANNHVVLFRRVDPRTGLDDPRAGDVLQRWFGGDPHHPSDAVRSAWFRKDPAADRAWAEAHEATVDRALVGALDGWAATPRGRLALVILLDQITRQIFRDTPRAFAGDPRAVRLVRDAIGQDEPASLAPWEHQFLLMPLMHSEDRGVQDLALAAFRDLADRDERFAGTFDYAVRHAEIVRRFGRYPHRNATLGRVSTAEEEAFLTQPGSSF